MVAKKFQNKISIDRLPSDKEFDLSFDDINDVFMSELLAELNEEVDVVEFASIDETPYLKFTGTLIKSYDDNNQHSIVIKGQLSVSFYTQCVKSGALMLDKMDVEVNAGVIDGALAPLYESNEEMILFIKGEQRDLFFYNEAGEIEFKEIISEYLFLNKNPYPSLEQTSS